MLPMIKHIQLNKRDPFQAFSRLLDDLGTNTGNYAINFGNTDVYEDDKNLYFDVELPGVSRNQINVVLEDGLLQLTVQRENSRVQNNEEGQVNVYLQERSTGQWSRNIQLPVEVNKDKINAKFENGVLNLTLEKQEAHKAHKIEIN